MKYKHIYPKSYSYILLFTYWLIQYLNLRGFQVKCLHFTTLRSEVLNCGCGVVAMLYIGKRKEILINRLQQLWLWLWAIV